MGFGTLAVLLSYNTRSSLHPCPLPLQKSAFSQPPRLPLIRLMLLDSLRPSTTRSILRDDKVRPSCSASGHGEIFPTPFSRERVPGRLCLLALLLPCLVGAYKVQDFQFACFADFWRHAGAGCGPLEDSRDGCPSSGRCLSQWLRVWKLPARSQTGVDAER